MYSVQLKYVFTVDIKLIFKFIGLHRWIMVSTRESSNSHEFLIAM